MCQNVWLAKLLPPTTCSLVMRGTNFSPKTWYISPWWRGARAIKLTRLIWTLITLSWVFLVEISWMSFHSWTTMHPWTSISINGLKFHIVYKVWTPKKKHTNWGLNHSNCSQNAVLKNSKGVGVVLPCLHNESLHLCPPKYLALNKGSCEANIEHKELLHFVFFFFSHYDTPNMRKKGKKIGVFFALRQPNFLHLHLYFCRAYIHISFTFTCVMWMFRHV